jgi:hypothetical protein
MATVVAVEVLVMEEVAVRGTVEAAGATIPLQTWPQTKRYV